MLYSQVKEAIKQSDKETVREILETYGEAVLMSALNCDVNIADILEVYQGKYSNDGEFVKQLLEDCGDIPKLPSYIYIDWEKTARDIMYDYVEDDGHYFRVI